MKKKMFILFFVSFPFFANVASAKKCINFNACFEKGKKAYDAKNYDEAIDYYSEAIVQWSFEPTYGKTYKNEESLSAAYGNRGNA